MLRSSFWLCALPFFLTTACATVPLPGRGVIDRPSLRPVKPLLEGRSGTLAVKGSPKTTDRVKLDPLPAQGRQTTSKKNTTQQKAQSPAAIKAKLQEAEDKSASAFSLAQSAQTPEDWQLVAQQWSKAIDLLSPLATQTTSLSPKIQQVLTEARRGLAAAQQSQAKKPSNSNAPIEFDRSQSRKTQGLIYGNTPSPSATPNSSPSSSPSSSAPTSNPPSSPSPSPQN